MFRYSLICPTRIACVLLVIGALLLATSVQAQVVIYSEPFTPYGNGTTVGSGAPPKWTRDISAASPNRFQVQSNEFESRRTLGPAKWITQTINISGYHDVALSAFIR